MHASEVGIRKNAALVWSVWSAVVLFYIEGALVVDVPKTAETFVTQFYCVDGPPSTLGTDEDGVNLFFSLYI